MNKKLVLQVFILTLFFNTIPAFADGFWYNVWDEIKFQFIRSRRPSVEMKEFPHIENKIYRIGSDYVYYSSLNPTKIERIGSKPVEYKMVNNEILKIGDDYVTYSASGKMLRVGNESVVYNGDKILRIGNKEVFYK